MRETTMLWILLASLAVSTAWFAVVARGQIEDLKQHVAECSCPAEPLREAVAEFEQITQDWAAEQVRIVGKKKPGP